MEQYLERFQKAEEDKRKRLAEAQTQAMVAAQLLKLEQIKQMSSSGVKQVVEPPQAAAPPTPVRDSLKPVPMAISPEPAAIPGLQAVPTRPLAAGLAMAPAAALQAGAPLVMGQTRLQAAAPLVTAHLSKNCAPMLVAPSQPVQYQQVPRAPASAVQASQPAQLTAPAGIMSMVVMSQPAKQQPVAATVHGASSTPMEQEPDLKMQMLQLQVQLKFQQELLKQQDIIK